jgi:hypothetical protein
MPWRYRLTLAGLAAPIAVIVASQVTSSSDVEQVLLYVALAMAVALAVIGHLLIAAEFRRPSSLRLDPPNLGPRDTTPGEGDPR